MKKSFISSILLFFVCLNQAYSQTSQFNTRDYDITKIKSNPDVIDDLDYKILLVLASGDDLLRQNLMGMIARSYRKRSEPVLRGQAAPYLARVQSAYYDEATKKWETVQGLGSFVKIDIDGKERTAVLTVSHLTQGQQLRIFDPKNRIVSIQPGMRLANIDNDVELIVLKDQVATPLRISPDFGFFSTEPLKLKELTDEMDMPDYDRIYVSKKQHVPILKSLLPKNSAGNTIYTFTQGREDSMRRLVTKTDLKDMVKSPSSIIKFMADMWDDEGVLQKQLVGSGYVAGARMLPGLSGAPLIRDMPYSWYVMNNKYVYIIEGMVQGHHRIENKSYFVGIGSIVQLLKDFKKGKRQFVTETRWRMKNGMTFRDFGGGVLETNMIKTPSGSLYKGDSGNAISVDGDYDPTAHGFGLGMQDGHGKNIVGQFLKVGNLTLPVMADPRMKFYDLPNGMERQESFGSDQGLWDLAKMKYQFRDQITDIVAPYECFYQVTDKGIDLQVNKFKGENILNWQASKTQLQKGFAKNDLIARSKEKKSAVEISGLFLTDLGNVVEQGGAKSAGAPTITILPREGVEASRVACFSSPDERREVYDKFRVDIMEGVETMVGGKIGLPPSPF